MTQQTGEWWMELTSKEALVSFMQSNKETVRTLAAKSIVRNPRTARGYKALSPAMIGHLRSGRRKTCSPETAAAVEKALGCPPNVLFVPRSSAKAA